jgi:hypothetical protein
MSPLSLVTMYCSFEPYQKGEMIPFLYLYLFLRLISSLLTLRLDKSVLFEPYQKSEAARHFQRERHDA